MWDTEVPTSQRCQNSGPAFCVPKMATRLSPPNEFFPVPSMDPCLVETPMVQSPMAVVSGQIYWQELVSGWIVERKTFADLSSSICDGRYDEPWIQRGSRAFEVVFGSRVYIYIYYILYVMYLYIYICNYVCLHNMCFLNYLCANVIVLDMYWLYVIYMM